MGAMRAFGSWFSGNSQDPAPQESEFEDSENYFDDFEEVAEDNVEQFPPLRVAEEAQMQRITKIEPKGYREAPTIGEHFRQGIPVVLNLTGLDEPEARRIVDFSSGLIFGLNGHIEKVATGVFLLTPEDVEVHEGSDEYESDDSDAGFYVN